MSSPAFNLEEHRAKRNRTLERENELLRGERSRLERLLADVLLVAVGGSKVSPLVLLDEIALLQGTDLSHGAFLEHREAQRQGAHIERVVRVLRETAA